MTKTRFVLPIACATALGFALSGCIGFSPALPPGFAPAAAPATTAAPKCPTDLANWLSHTGNTDMSTIYRAMGTVVQDNSYNNSHSFSSMPIDDDSVTAAHDVAQALSHAPMPSDAGAALTDYTKALQTGQAAETAYSSGGTNTTAVTDYRDAQGLLNAANTALQAAGCSVVHF